MCAWKVKPCDPLVTHGQYLSTLEIKALYIKVIHKFICLLTFYIYFFTLSLNLFLANQDTACRHKYR